MRWAGPGFAQKGLLSPSHGPLLGPLAHCRQLFHSIPPSPLSKSSGPLWHWADRGIWVSEMNVQDIEYMQNTAPSPSYAQYYLYLTRELCFHQILNDLFFFFFYESGKLGKIPFFFFFEKSHFWKHSSGSVVVGPGRESQGL